MKVASSFLDCIGHTPLIELTSIEKAYDLPFRLLAKLEKLNPAGSIKDRIAMQMILDLEESGEIDKDTVLIEPTSGNTGIGLAAICAKKGYRLIIVMPESMSIERRKMMKGYGAELVLTPASLGMKGSIAKAEELKASFPKARIIGQFENPSNPKAHYLHTGPEIYEDTDGEVDVLISPIGTGGTLSGISRYLKGKKESVIVLGVEPAGSPVLTQGHAGKHAIQGIGAGFVPNTLDTKAYDRVLTVTDEDALACAREVGHKEGVLVGISSGAALSAALQIAKEKEFAGKTVVIIFPDGGERYLSTALFED